MKKTALLLAASVAASWLGIAAATAAPDAEPTAVVKQLYAEPHPEHSQTYTKRLQTLFDSGSRQNGGALGTLDFDYRLNGQPVTADSVRSLRFLEAASGPGKAEVDVTLPNKPDQHVVFDLVQEDGTWRVDDVHSIGDPTWRLSKILTGEAR